MRRILILQIVLGFLAILRVQPSAGAAATDLFFSEYVEGSSTNKYIEIYNGTGADVDLSNYVLRLYSNGGATPTTTNRLSGTLTNGTVVVYRNSSAALTLPEGVVAVVASACNWNGDDAISLYNMSAATNVDIFGRIGEDPGNAWTNGTLSTLDRTLRRKSSVTGGVAANPDAGFPALATEWDGYPRDTVDGLGSHTMDGGATATNVPPRIATIGARSIRPGEDLSFDVVATDSTDGDEIVLAATNLPAGAVFEAVTNVAAVTNSFLWSGAAPEGSYEVFFLATDKDGTTTQRVPITVAAPVPPSLLISEYGEGSSYNKYIELFNFGSNTVDLSQYTLQQAYNGTNVFGSALTLSGTLPFNTAYVIAHGSAGTQLKAKANLISSSTVMTFTGNDAIGLFQNGSLIDVVGPTNSSANWGVDVSLIRKSSVTTPSTTYDPAQWNSMPVDSWDNVGLHTMDGLPPQSNRPPVLDFINNQVVVQGSNLSFTVTAHDTVDNDEIRIWASSVPAGATFTPVTNVTSATGMFSWYGASPTGVYSTTFFAGDKDATNSQSVSITVVRAVAPTQSVVALINEVQPNDTGSDDAECVELICLAGVNLQGCKLVHHNGSDGSDGGIWKFTFPDYTVPTSGVYDVEGRELGFVSLVQTNSSITNATFVMPRDPSDTTNTVPASLQNGPDGLVLYDASGEVLDAVVWPAWGTTATGDVSTDDPGAILATGGDTAMPNYLHTLPADPSDDQDLQAPDNVLADPGSGWVGLVPTPGAINGSQVSGQIIMTRPKPKELKGLLMIVR
jgi:hypothetical protein